MIHSKSMLISGANQSQREVLKRIITMLYLLDILLIGSSTAEGRSSLSHRV